MSDIQKHWDWKFDQEAYEKCVGYGEWVKQAEVKVFKDKEND